MTDAQLDQLAINTIRTLSIDAVQAANSGHPGTPMALAPLVYTLWNRVLRFDPQDPIWPNRDRFVLSNGHASMLLWSVLHLTGTRAVNADYEQVGTLAVTLDDIRRFRQLGSKAPGHPEYHLVSGVETTTGPLGQGIATSVGMAIAQRWLASRYNRPGFDVFDYVVYAVCSDGDLMEGVGSEAASLAGHLGLENLCWIYDNNHITIEGSTRLAFTEDVAARFASYAWNVLRVEDANDVDRMDRRPRRVPAERRAGRPSSSSTPTSATGRRTSTTPPPRTVSRSARRRSASPSAPTAGRRTRSSWCPRACASTSRRGSARGARRPGAGGPRPSRRYRSKFPRLADRDRPDAATRSFPPGWDRDLPVFPADPKGLSGRDAVRPGAERARRERALARSAARPTSGPRPGPASRSRALATSRRRPRAAGTCTSASVSTPWRRS